MGGDVLNTDPLEETARDIEQAITKEQAAALRARLDGPLAVVAAGGSMPAAAFWAQLHERYANQPAWALPPFALVDRGVPSGARVLVLSAGGGHHDVLRAARAATGAGAVASAVVCRPSSPLSRWMTEAGGPDAVLELPKPVAADKVLAVHAMVPLLVAAARLYGGVGPWAPCFGAPAEPASPSRPRYVVSLGTGFAAPAAMDFAYKCKESGLAPAWYDDVRDFAHGPFITLDRVPEGALVVAFATGEQRAYLERYLEGFPTSARVVLVSVASSGITAGLELFARSMRTFEQFGREADVLCGPERIAAWGAGIYNLEP